MQPNNQMRQNNPWGFQAQNWSQPISRGPPPQQARPNMNRFMSPPGQVNIASTRANLCLGDNCAFCYLFGKVSVIFK